MEDPGAHSPIPSSGVAADESFPVPEPGSAHGSYKSDGLLSGGDGGSVGGYDAEFGFQRPEFRQEGLAGTVGMYERHLFLCYKDPQVWPSHVEAAEFDRLPRLLSAAIKAHKADIKKQTRLTLCEGEDGTESSNGDVLIFPDMVRYRRLTHFDVEAFVEEVLVKNTEWYAGVVEQLHGSYVFVCSHASRDKRCGVCGPALIKRFREEIGESGLQVTVSACSHVGGHKYAGNVIIFCPTGDGVVTGHWYGYVSPDDVPLLLDQHIGKGEIVTHLWRGQMGLSEEQQKKAQEGREEPKQSLDGAPGGVCCQGVGNSTCCQTVPPDEKAKSDGAAEKTSNATGGSSTCAPRKNCPMPTFFERWERADTYAALAVAAAVVSVAVACVCYRQTR